MKKIDLISRVFFYISAAKTKSKVVPDEGNIMMLTDMAFTRDQAIKALKETDNNVERAVDWIFNHPNDMGGDVEEEAGTSKLHMYVHFHSVELSRFFCRSDFT